ncbi:MAG TPA: GNAT family N-acetyltransferase [Burkholderiales bacterium]|nr:GNAT family N-acetyltransferase [Burkholderiales bacterium]
MEPLPARYPFDLVDVWHARDGERVLVRPVHPQDLELAQAFVRELSPESRYNRFHGTMKELTPGMARWATHVDYDRHMALIAVVYGDGREIEIGAARYVVRADGETAEFAVAVADTWQGQGLGARLLSDLTRVAAGRGLRWIEGEVLASNRGMLALARRLGFDYRKPHRDARLVTVSRRLRAEDARAAKPAPSAWRGLLRTLHLSRLSPA